jgi:hypothetical protein
VWWRGALDLDDVTLADCAARSRDRHDPGLSDELSIGSPADHRREQPTLKSLDLDTRISQAGHLEHRLSDPQDRTLRQGQQIDAAGRNVLAEITGLHPETPQLQFIEELGMNQVHLTQIRLGGIDSNPRPVLYIAPLVRVPFHTQPSRDPDFRKDLFRKAMLVASCDGNDRTDVTHTRFSVKCCGGRAN